MKVASLLFALLLLPIVANAQRLSYPITKKDNVVENYHGTKVADPYRWLEDLDSPETAAWVKAQNEVTYGYLTQIPQREAIKKRLTELWNYEKYGAPWKKGGLYFSSKNNGLQNQYVYYVQKSLTDPQPRVLLDPNKFSTDGTVALSTLEVSEDGRLLGYGTSASGSDWQTFHVRDVQTGKDLSDELKWIKFSGLSWSHDSRGFFYSRYDEPTPGQAMEEANRNQKLYYHRVGTPQSKDELVYARPDDPDLSLNGYVTDDGRYLGIVVGKGTDPRNGFHYKDLLGGGKIVRLLDKFDAAYSPVGNDGTLFYFLTDQGAPNYRVVAIDLKHPEPSAWKEIIPESKAVLQSVQMVNDQFVVTALDDVKGRLTIHDRSGKLLQEIELPTVGAVTGVSGSRKDREMFYTFTSFTYPSTIYRYDFATGRSEVYRAPKVNFDPSAYETHQVWYTSKDGTRVPMFIVHKKGLKRDGSNPTHLYAYGGFNISMTPSFSVSNLVWLEMGGVYAMPNLRGGGEFGKEWHQAGTKERKQNVFDDFIGAAEYLIKEGYTSTPKLSISGRSNGGLLTGAALTQRPDLFGAVVVGVGVLDMLRFHKFTIGWAWTSDYGSSDDPEGFRYLYAYSPLHNLKPGTKYPATLIQTADHDDRVVPSHSFKFASTLQAAQGGDEPVLIRIETKAGHGAGKPTTKLIEDEADRWAFIVHETGFTNAILPQ